MPLELKAKRSLLILRIDTHVFNSREQEIMDEIENWNEWVGKITEIYKFLNNKILKLTFDETVKAPKATEAGIHAFSIRLAKYDIRRGASYGVNTCYIYNELEAHTTSNCHKEIEYIKYARSVAKDTSGEIVRQT